MRAARFALLAIAVLGAILATLRGQAAPPGAPDSFAASSSAPTRCRRNVLANAGLCLEPRTRRVLLRVRARDESLVRRELGLLVERLDRRRIGQVLPRGERSPLRPPTSQKSDSEEHRAGAGVTTKIAAHPDSGDLGQPRPAVVHGQAVRALRPRPRRHDAWRDRVEQAVRVQHALGVDTGPDGVEARPRSLGARRGRDGVRCLVPGLIRKVIRTHTNVADQRELYSFHLEDSWWQVARWRVRPVRQVVGALPNGLPAVSYGPWSPTYATTNPGWAAGKLQLGAAVSDRGEHGHEGRRPSAHARDDVRRATPEPTDVSTGSSASYAFTDRDCVNAVFRGSVVGGPAFAPRDLTDRSSCRRTRRSSTSRSPASSRARSPRTRRPSWPTERRSPRARRGARTISSASTSPTSTRRPRATSGRSFPSGSTSTRTGRSRTTTPSRRRTRASPVAWPASARSRGRAITGAGTPFVSGLTPKGRLLAQAGRRPVVYSTPLVAWRPVIGATGYEVQWSRSKYPWRARGSVLTVRDLVGAPDSAPGSGTTASADSTPRRSARRR